LQYKVKYTQVYIVTVGQNPCTSIFILICGHKSMLSVT